MQTITGTQSERLQGDVLDALLDGVVTIAADGTILGFNKAAEGIFGYPRDKVAGQNVRILMPEPFRGAHDGYLRSYLETGEARIIGTGRNVLGQRSDGSVFPMHLAISEGVSGDQRFFTGIVRDITDDEQANARLRSSFMLLFRRSNEPMLLTDGRGTILDANSQMCRLLGLEKEDLLRAHPRDFIVGGEEANLRYRALREEFGAVSSNARVRTASGREVDISYWEVEFADEHGNRRSLIGGNEIAVERELARVGSVLQSLFENSTDGYLLTNDVGDTIFVNRSHVEIWGLTMEDLSRPFSERQEKTQLGLERPEELVGLLAEANEKPDEAISGLVSLKNGRIVEVRTTPIYSQDGERYGRSFSTRDITAQARSEAEVQRIASLLEAEAAHSPEGILVTDLDGSVLHYNQRFLDLWEVDEAWTRLAPDERWRMLVPRALDQAAFAQASTQLSRDMVLEFEGEFAMANGKTIRLQAVRLKDADGAVLGRASFYRDVTADRAAEAVLRESEERYRKLVSSLPVGVVMQYADGKIAASNEAAEHILGLTADQMLGLTAYDPRWRCIGEDGRDFPKEAHPSVITLRTGEPCTNVIMGVHHANGSLRWVLINSAPLRREDEALSGVVISFLDITERRQAEELLAKSRTAEAFQALASGVAHKINNSLTSIVGNAYLAGLSDGLPEETVEGLAEITRASAGASGLVRDLLALSGRSRRSFAPVDVSQKTAGVLEGLGLEERNHVAAELAGDLPTVMVEPDMLRQAIGNILRNALEAGDVVHVRTLLAQDFQPPATSVFAPTRPPSGRYVVIEVADDGPGIPPEMVGRLFEPFASTKFTGRGLGLAATAGILGAQGGFVEIRSSGAGCTARLLLPTP